MTTTDLLLKENLTAMELQVMESFITGLYAEPGFSDVDISDLVIWTKIPAKSLRGVLSSLVKKDFIYITDCEQYQMIYLCENKFYLHPEWSLEIN